MLLMSGYQWTKNTNMGLGGVSPNKSQNLYQEEASLVFNQLASVQEILPILSVISEVRIKHLHALKYTHHGRTYI
jgi:hypothetical protein